MSIPDHHVIINILENNEKPAFQTKPAFRRSTPEHKTDTPEKNKINTSGNKYRRKFNKVLYHINKQKKIIDIFEYRGGKGLLYISIQRRKNLWRKKYTYCFFSGKNEVFFKFFLNLMIE